MLRMPFARNLSCTGMKKSRKASQVFGMSSTVYPAFSIQRSPDIERNRAALHRHRIIRALLCDVIISISPAKCGVDVLRLDGFDDVADIDELVGPGVQREKREVG